MFVASESNAGITLPVEKTAGKLEKCVRGTVEKTFNKSLKSIENYAEDIQSSAADVVSGTAFIESLDELKESTEELEESYTEMTEDVMDPINKAYESVNLAMVENMAAFAEMTEAMKNRESRKVYFIENGEKIAVNIGVDEVSDSVFEAIDTIATYDEMSGAIDAINEGKESAKNSSGKAKKSKSRAMKNIGKFEKVASKLTGEDFSLNDMIKNIDALKEAEKIMNLDKMDIPPELSTVANLAAMKPVLDAFMAMDTLEKGEQIEEFVTTLESVAELQAMQDSVFTTLSAATEVSENLEKLQQIMAVFSAEPSSIRSIAIATENAQEVYDDTKEQIADIEKMVENLKKAVENVESIKGTFDEDVAGIKKLFEESVDLGTLLESLALFEGLKPTIDSVISYIDLSGESEDLYDSLLNFGENAEDTEAILSFAEPHVDKAKEKASEWKDDIKGFFKDPKEKEAKEKEVAEKSNEVNDKESKAKALKAKYKDFKEDKDKAKANLDYLKDVYSDNKDALKKIKKAQSKLEKIADETQIEKFATDTLGLTDASKDVLDAYKEVSKVDEEKLTGPLDDFKDQLDKFKDVKDQLKDVQELADTMSESKQIVEGLANNIQNLGGLIKCFDIDVDAILKDTMLRVQDYIVEEMRQKLWEEYSKAVVDMPYLLLPEDTEDEFDSPFKKSKELKKIPLSQNKVVNDLIKLAGVKQEELHPLSGQRFAGVTTFESASTIDDFRYETTIEVDNEGFEGEFDYTDALGAWEISYLPIPKVESVGVKWDFGDWSTTAWAPVLGGLECGINPKNDFCWYWQWQSCLFVSKCYKVPLLLPSCMTNFDYKEPTVHVEISPRSGTSHLLYMKFLRDVPRSIGDWATGGHEPIPSAHVVGISPEARYMSKIGIDGANLTMICDLAQKMERFEHIQYYGIPTSPAKAAMEIGKSLVTLKDWKTEWFTEEAGELGKFPASLQALYMTEMNKSAWNPRTFPNGETPSGETKPDFEDDREKSYKWALPYLKTGSDSSGTAIVEDIMMNKCDAGLESDGTNVCLGTWGALFPRNGHVSIEDSRYPLKRFVQLAYRAYDRALENNAISSLKVQPGTEMYGVGYENTEFSLEWPYKTKRMKVGEHPANWAKGYFGEDMNSGGLVMTLWKDTSCCVKVCCAYPGTGFKPGETYYFPLPYWEDKEWGITEVSEHK
jgi:hypothetical protein